MPSPPPASRTRRDVVATAALAFAGVGAVAAAWPLATSLAPNRAAPRRLAKVELPGIAVGDTRVVSWEGTPVAVRHRTTREIEAALSADIAALRDGLARAAGLDPKARATDQNRTKAGQPQWLVVVALCPRNRCLVKPLRSGDDGDPRIAWICPCDACRFDSSGRIVSGPALENLAVPPFRFTGTDTIEIGIV